MRMRRFGSLRLFVTVACGALAASCDSGPGSGGGSSRTASISGRLRYVSGPGARTVIESEPNDWPELSQFLGQPAAGQVYLILGTVTSAEQGDIDTYRFTTVEPLNVTWTVRSDDPHAGAGFDLDVGVIDFKTLACRMDGVELEIFSECHPSALLAAGALFTADGTFEIVVAGRVGAGSYLLEVAFEAAESAGASATARTAVQPLPELRAVKGQPANASLRALSDTVSPPQGAVVPGETLVRFDPSLRPSDIEELVSHRGMRIVERAPCGVHRLAWPVADKTDPARLRQHAYKAAADLAALPGVVWAEPNQVFAASAVPDDELYGSQRHAELIRLPDAWDVTTGSRDVIVAVIDTGVVYQHPDLGGRLIGGYDFVSDPEQALDGDGRDDDPSDPGDAPDRAEGSSFHGTHISGILAAIANNGAGVTGVTWSGRVMPVRALGRSSRGDAFDVAEAIRYAAGLANVSGTVPPRRADVINLSFDGGAGDASSQTVQTAVREAAEAGVVLVGAAGNQGSSAPRYPAAFDEVISVGAVDWSLERPDYSDFGPTLDLVAPGGSAHPRPDGEPGGILSTVASDLTDPMTLDFGYQFGTSQACVQVSGVAGLMLSVNPHLSSDQVRDILHATAQDLGEPGRDDEYGYGLLDAAAAVDLARATRGEASRPPALSASPAVLDFGTDQSVLTVTVENAGDGVLQIDSVWAEEQASGGWLSVVSGAAAAGATIGSIEARVNRDGLPDGAYRGAIHITLADGGSAAIDVFAAVTDPSGPPDVVHVVAVDPETGAILARTTTALEQGLEFGLDTSGLGPVLLFAGTDRDGDGTICEADDACGAWPSLLDPVAVEPDRAGPLEAGGIPLFEPSSSDDWPVEFAPLASVRALSGE